MLQLYLCSMNINMGFSIHRYRYRLKRDMGPTSNPLIRGMFTGPKHTYTKKNVFFFTSYGFFTTKNKIFILGTAWCLDYMVAHCTIRTKGLYEIWSFIFSFSPQIYSAMFLWGVGGWGYKLGHVSFLPIQFAKYVHCEKLDHVYMKIDTPVCLHDFGLFLRIFSKVVESTQLSLKYSLQELQ